MWHVDRHKQLDRALDELASWNERGCSPRTRCPWWESDVAAVVGSGASPVVYHLGIDSPQATPESSAMMRDEKSAQERRARVDTWIADYDAARARAIRWLGDRYLLARPINRL